MVHELKCESDYFGRVMSGQKKVELRLNDRHYAVGDILRLREIYSVLQDRSQDSEGESILYTGRISSLVVTDIVDDPDCRWLQPGVIAMSVRWVLTPDLNALSENKKGDPDENR